MLAVHRPAPNRLNEKQNKYALPINAGVKKDEHLAEWISENHMARGVDISAL